VKAGPVRRRSPMIATALAGASTGRSDDRIHRAAGADADERNGDATIVPIAGAEGGPLL